VSAFEYRAIDVLVVRVGARRAQTTTVVPGALGVARGSSIPGIRPRGRRRANRLRAPSLEQLRGVSGVARGALLAATRAARRAGRVHARARDTPRRRARAVRAPVSRETKRAGAGRRKHRRFRHSFRGHILPLALGRLTSFFVSVPSRARLRAARRRRPRATARVRPAARRSSGRRRGRAGVCRPDAAEAVARRGRR
jgi:hypothetical protein